MKQPDREVDGDDDAEVPGSMPTDLTIGTSSGLSSKIAKSGSRKQPTSSSRMLIASSSIQADTLSDCSQAATSLSNEGAAQPDKHPRAGR